MKKFLFRLLYHSGFHHLLRFLLRPRAIILTYHGFTDRGHHGGIENYQGKHVSIERFRQQLNYLKKYYRVISLTELVACYRRGSQPPDHSVVITFDDGYRSNYTLAYPLLRELGLPATIFLTTAFVDRKEPLWTDRVEYAIGKSKSSHLVLKDGPAKDAVTLDIHDREQKAATDERIRADVKSRAADFEMIEALEGEAGESLSFQKEVPEIYRPLEWGEVSEMIESGLISVGSHTCHHLILTRCEADGIRKELAESREVIEKKTGLPCHLFCYPNGGIGDFSELTKGLLASTGYACGLTSVPGFNDARSDPYELKRLGIRDQSDFPEFVMTLGGMKMFLSRLRRRLKSIGAFLG